MSDQPPVPAADNTFERIKRVSPEGNESWSARDLARVLEYSEFRHFLSIHSIQAHFQEIVALKVIKACLAERDKVKKVEISSIFLLTSI